MKNQVKFMTSLVVAFAVFLGVSTLSDNKAEASGYGATPEEVDGLHPTVAEAANTLKLRAAEKGILIRITDGYRSSEAQDELYSQGRTEPGQVVTYAKGGESYHNHGLAIDYVLLDSSGNASWDVERDANGNGKSDWVEVADIGKELGFTWGGDWDDFVDYPHLQMDFGYSLDDLN